LLKRVVLSRATLFFCCNGLRGSTDLHGLARRKIEKSGRFLAKNAKSAEDAKEDEEFKIKPADSRFGLVRVVRGDFIKRIRAEAQRHGGGK